MNQTTEMLLRITKRAIAATILALAISKTNSNDMN